MIHALASFFRGIHMGIGATAPPKDAPYEVERKFVLLWLGLILFMIGWCALLLYLLGVL